MPFGLVILNVVPDRSLKVVLGVAVLVATVLLVRRINLSHVGPGLDITTGFLSGLLNTSLSTNGPPLVFNLQARHLAPDEFRATITRVFALSNIVGLSLFLLDGKVTADGLKAALRSPCPRGDWANCWAGRCARHVHGERFRVMVLALLFVAGTSTIVFALT
jgi:uncharacterized membrane protein YfcA